MLCRNPKRVHQDPKAVTLMRFTVKTVDFKFEVGVNLALSDDHTFNFDVMFSQLAALERAFWIKKTSFRNVLSSASPGSPI